MYPADILAEMEAFFKKFIEMQFTVVGSDLLPVVGGNLIYRASGGCALHDAVRSVMFWSVRRADYGPVPENFMPWKHL